MDTDGQVQPLRLDNPAAEALPRTLVFFERTPANFPSARYRARVDADPAPGATPYLLLDAGHDAMRADTAAVAALLLALAAR